MKIALGQTRSIKGQIQANILTHKKLIDLAIVQNAQAIFFPELSITGYEPELAEALALDFEDEVFNDFQEISNNKNITISLGMPIRDSEGVKISMLIFQPQVSRQVYSKQLLHEDEFPYFTHGKEQMILTLNNSKIAPAICFESLQIEHANNAFQLGAEIYVASVAKSQQGIDKAMKHYPSIAIRYSMPVFMANCVGFCDNFESVGHSAVWTNQGVLVGQLDDRTQGILIFDTETEELVKKYL
jgi:predicted amidohydrolase